MKPKASTIIFETTVAGYTVMLFQNPDRTFATRYGKEFTTNLSYTEAATSLGSILMHGFTCEGKIED